MAWAERWGSEEGGIPACGDSAYCRFTVLQRWMSIYIAALPIKGEACWSVEEDEDNGIQNRRHDEGFPASPAQE